MTYDEDHADREVRKQYDKIDQAVVRSCQTMRSLGERVERARRESEREFPAAPRDAKALPPKR